MVKFHELGGLRIGWPLDILNTKCSANDCSIENSYEGRMGRSVANSDNRSRSKAAETNQVYLVVYYYKKGYPSPDIETDFRNYAELEAHLKAEVISLIEHECHTIRVYEYDDELDHFVPVKELECRSLLSHGIITDIRTIGKPKTSESAALDTSTKPSPL